MKILNLLSEVGAAGANKYIEKLKEEDPDQFDRIADLFVNLTDLGVHILRTSPEFRDQFARIHTEFMKYPECQEVIIESKEAIERYSQEMAGK